jgi:hypothetical protein
MRDPHVVALRYRLGTPTSATFADAAALEEETDNFHLHLSNGKLTVRMKGHHATVESARACVDPYLKAWEISTGLQFGSQLLGFAFDPPAEIIDRDPPPPGTRAFISGVAHVTIGAVTCVATAHAKYGFYPKPPQEFAASPDVECLWLRYKMYKEGKEPLLSMAYFCLTLLEGTTGKKQGFRDAVCTKYGIDRDVRDKLGDLVSERGGPEEARKFDAGTTRTPLTPNERTWVEEVIKALIQRKAQYDANPTAPWRQIIMSQFIPL